MTQDSVLSKLEFRKSTMKSLILAGFTGAVCMLMTGCCTPQKTTAWEYRVVHGLPQRPEFEQKLNQAGSEGFTIVSSTAMTLQPAELPETLVILKRRAR